ncbi:MAG TPA: LptF/LptG family permease, partial [Aliiroseovarius sp.]|nr:LptF/LptG family permease [Aliiroseovarius sp.]
LLVRAEDGPRLVMFKGLAQVLDTASDRLTITAFDNFTFNLAALVENDFLGKRSFFHLPTRDLLAASPAIQRETGQDRAFLRTEAFARTARALLSVVAAMAGFATLLLGGFSRFGLWRQILGAIVLLALVQFLDNALTQMARIGQAPATIVFVSPAVGLALIGLLLWLSPRLVWLPWRRRGVPVSGVAA